MGTAEDTIRAGGFSEKQLKAPPSRQELYNLCGALADAVKAQKALIDDLEARADAFRGVHQRALSYRKGNFVTHKGALWAALCDTPSGKIPGEDHAFWQLAAKGG